MPSPNPPPAADRALRVGFVPLTDAAPLIAAQAHGHFARHHLRVQLSREVGWATVRDKLLLGELDAAQAPAPMLWAAELGLGGAAFRVCTALVLSRNGNAITLSSRLRAQGVTDGASLRIEARRRRGESRLTFGVVYPYSMHNLLLRSWLRMNRLDPDRDVRIAVVPPAQMFRNLAAGTIDGYCAGEPWNSVAVADQTGWCPVWSAAQAPRHLEKVLMVRTKFADELPEKHAALIAALVAAAQWCDQASNRAELAKLLAERDWLNLPAQLVASTLTGRFDCGGGRVERAPDFHIFHREGANEPIPAEAAALQDELVAAGLVPRAAAKAGLPGRLFRSDLYRAALGGH
jgi:ABC-type nitrate/sulfonate/bicarbonate transport system substrate-binding protein